MDIEDGGGQALYYRWISSALVGKTNAVQQCRGNAEHFLWTFLGGGEEWGRILSPRFCDQSPSKPSQKEKEKKKPSSQATKNSTFTNTYDFIPYTIKTRPLMTKVPIHLVVRLGLSQADHFKSIKNP